MAKRGSDKLKAIKSVALYLPVHAAITALTWRDLRQRPAEQVRGDKRLWQLASGVNTLGSVLYFALGRRRGASR